MTTPTRRYDDMAGIRFTTIFKRRISQFTAFSSGRRQEQNKIPE
jgi:hypothetical protein